MLAVEQRQNVLWKFITLLNIAFNFVLLAVIFKGIVS
jgi:hypothetical protein